MSSRLSDLPLIVLAIALVSNFILFAVEGPSSLQPAPAGTLAGIIGTWIMELFPIYEALVIQKALAVRLYRNQARGIGLVAFSILLLGSAQLVISPFVTPKGTGAFGTPINYPFIYFTWLVLFYWIDVSTRAARHLDPFYGIHYIGAGSE